jgi:hypothetical protein
MSKVKYGVKSEWVIVDKISHRTGRIWLDEIDDKTGREIWRAYWTYKDGSQPFNSSEWGPSYQSMRNWLPLDGKAKRVL